MAYIKRATRNLFIIFHSLVFGIYPFLAAWEFNYFEAYPQNFWSIFPWIIAGTISFLFVFKRILGLINVAAIFYTALILTTLCYGSLVKYLQGGSADDSSGLGAFAV